MEDAFATDDTKEPTMDGSDPDMTPDAGVDKIPSHYDDSTDQGKPAVPEPSKKAVSPKPRRNTEPAIPTTLADPQPLKLPPPAADSASADQADADKSSKKDKKPTKSHSKKKLGTRIKPVQPMEALREEGEEEESSIATSATESATSVVVAETPSKKKPNGFLSFFKRLGTPKAQKNPGLSSEEHSGSDPQPSAPLNAAGPATPPRSPRSPRGKNSTIYAEGYEAMRSEIRTYLDTEKIFLSELVTLRDEYLLPASRLSVPIEHVAVLLPHVEHLISCHSDTLKQVEKKQLQDSIPIGSIFDDLLAAVGDTYKQYRPKQVILLSLLDSSPNEKSMADHAAISNWLTTRTEEQQANAAANATSSSAPATAASTSNAAKRSQSVSAALAARPVLPLQELILVPLHHLVGIVSLLDRMLEVTPQVHPDHPNIRKASARAHLLQTDFSARGTTYRSMAKLTEIDAMLEFPSGSPLVLADETSKRSYLLEGSLHQLEQQVDHSQFSKIYMFLFSDMVLICKQLARDPGALSRTPSAVSRRRQSGRRQSSTNAKAASALTPRGEREPANGPAPAPITATPINKYIVISKLMLDRLFVVDPEDVHGEMTTFSNAKAAAMDSPAGIRKSPSPPANGSSTNNTPSKLRKGSKTSSTEGDEEVDTSTSEEVRELEDFDCLLELVDMGVGIHRLRFSSPSDKKLWLATLSSALSNIKLSFSVNERQYLYKLLMTTDPKPIFGVNPNDEKLYLWPSGRFVASLASRQLIERLHSNTFATVNLQRSFNNSSPASAQSQNPDSELALIKAEVINLKREHARQVADFNARREMDALEIASLQKTVREQTDTIILNTDSPAKGRRPRSGTVDSSASSNGSKRKPATRKTKAAVAAAEARAEEYINKYMDLVTSANAREKRDMEISRRLDANETALRDHSDKLSASLSSVTAALEKSQRELEEAKADRKAMAAQTERLNALIEKLLTSGSGSSNILAGSGTFSASSSTTSIGGGASGAPASRAPIKKDPSSTPVSDRIAARSNSATGKPPVPIKHSVGGGSTPNSPVVVAPVATKGQPATINGGSWRAPPTAGGGVGQPVAPGSPGPNGATVMSGSPAPHPAIMSIGQRGKRPSSASLIAAAPLEMPEAGVTADSSESSTSGNPQGLISSRGVPQSASPAPASPVVPALFGTAGKSSSKLNLTANGANGAPAAGAPGAAGGPPVSPGGRNREKKLKNVRFPDGAEDQGKSGSWLSKKLGFASPKTKKEETPTSKAPWRDPPSASSAGTDSPITVKKANKVDWSQTRAESYFSDDAASDYEGVNREFPSEFDRPQPDFMGSEGSEEAAQ